MFSALIPTLHDQILELKLEGFDEGGIWVQSQKLTDQIMRKLNQTALPTTPVIFVPYSAFHYAFVQVNELSLSDEKFGL